MLLALCVIGIIFDILSTRTGPLLHTIYSTPYITSIVIVIVLFLEVHCYNSKIRPTFSISHAVTVVVITLRRLLLHRPCQFFLFVIVIYLALGVTDYIVVIVLRFWHSSHSSLPSGVHCYCYKISLKLWVNRTAVHKRSHFYTFLKFSFFKFQLSSLQICQSLSRAFSP